MLATTGFCRRKVISPGGSLGPCCRGLQRWRRQRDNRRTCSFQIERRADGERSGVSGNRLRASGIEFSARCNDRTARCASKPRPRRRQNLPKLALRNRFVLIDVLVGRAKTEIPVYGVPAYRPEQKDALLLVCCPIDKFTKSSTAWDSSLRQLTLRITAIIGTSIILSEAKNPGPCGSFVKLFAGHHTSCDQCPGFGRRWRGTRIGSGRDLSLSVEIVMIRVRGVFCLVASLLTGCAGVTAHQLNPGMTDTVGPEGLRYYMPAPYLLVAELPPVGVTGQSPEAPMQNPPNVTLPQPEAPPGVVSNPSPKGSLRAKRRSSPGGSSANPPDGSGNATASGPGPSSSTSVTSFAASTPQYVIKLVYLPDLSRPMALTESTGLFGTYGMKPALQDGWMLTSLDATGNSGVPETLASLASILGAAVGAPSKPGGPPPPTARDLRGFFAPGRFILRPGLYKFAYDPRGQLIGLQALTYFTGLGAISTSAPTGLLSAGPPASTSMKTH